MSIYKKIGLGFVFTWFFVGGIAHFVVTDFFLNIMPPYFPLHLEAVYISGVFEIVGAIGLLIPRFRTLAGNGLILLTLCVTPANVHMWLNPELFPEVPPFALTLRLFVQVLLLACIWWSTRPMDTLSVTANSKHTEGALNQS